MTVFRSVRRVAAPLLLACASLMALPASPVHAAELAVAASAAFHLPARPSEMLRVPQATWEPLLVEAAAQLEAQARSFDALPRGARIELCIRRALLAQMRGQWAEAIAAVTQARQLQDNENGRHMAGLLNELLARHALAQAAPQDLTKALRERVLAMPWDEVGATVRTLSAQLATMKAEDVEAFVVQRLDLSAEVTRRQVDLAFVMQVIGLRFQLLEVLPRRDALLAGLDEAIAVRERAQ